MLFSPSAPPPMLPELFFLMKGSDLGTAALVVIGPVRTQTNKKLRETRPPQVFTPKNPLLETTGGRVGRPTWSSLDWCKSLPGRQ